MMERKNTNTSTLLFKSNIISTGNMRILTISIKNPFLI